jgi:hypothetical protein
MILGKGIDAHDTCKKYKEHMHEQKRIAEARKEEPQKENRRSYLYV